MLYTRVRDGVLMKTKICFQPLGSASEELTLESAEALRCVGVSSLRERERERERGTICIACDDNFRDTVI